MNKSCTGWRTPRKQGAVVNGISMLPSYLDQSLLKFLKDISGMVLVLNNRIRRGFRLHECEESPGVHCKKPSSQDTEHSVSVGWAALRRG